MNSRADAVLNMQITLIHILELKGKLKAVERHAWEIWYIKLYKRILWSI